MLNKFKRSIFEALYGNRKGFIYMIDDYLINGLILLNVTAIILESFDSIYNQYGNLFHIFELFSVIIFSIEYISRVWVADLRFKNLSPFKARLKYISSFMGLIDLFAIIPFYLPFLVSLDLRTLRILRILRLFRIFKLAHYSSSLRLVGKVFNKKKEELFITLVLSVLILLITSSIMYKLEHDVQPDNFENIFATLWWAVATLTTIGYGDVYPVTAWGKILAAVTAIFGIGVVAIPTGILSAGFLEEIQNKKAKDNPRQRKLKRIRR